jgi:hypothetical protein
VEGYKKRGNYFEDKATRFMERILIAKEPIVWAKNSKMRMM